MMSTCLRWRGRIGIFGCELLSTAVAFSILAKIGFDCRVQKDSMIVKTVGFDYRGRDSSDLVSISPRAAELVNYIFGKPELACYKLLRETNEEVQQLKEESGPSKIHQAIV